MADPRFAWLDGAVVPIAQARVSVLDRGLLFAEALYEVVPITNGQLRFVDYHVERMRRGAKELRLDAGVPAVQRWREAARELADAESLREGILYAQVTGGSGPRDHIGPAERRPRFFAFVQPLRFPRGDHGLRAISSPDSRWARCDLKTTMLLPSVLAKHEAANADADEVVFFDSSGRITEGASTTVGIVDEGRLVFVPASRAVLPGVTQRVVSELAKELEIGTETRALWLDDLTAADEVFVASTTKLVLPLIELDGQRLRTGLVCSRVAAALRRRLDLD